MLEGAIFGLISFISMVFTWRNLPTWFKNLCLQYPLAAEWLSTLSAFLMMTSISASLVSVVGAAVYGLCVNLAMEAYKHWYGVPNEVLR